MKNQMETKTNWVPRTAAYMLSPFITLTEWDSYDHRVTVGCCLQTGHRLPYHSLHPLLLLDQFPGRTLHIYLNHSRLEIPPGKNQGRVRSEAQVVVKDLEENNMLLLVVFLVEGKTLPFFFFLEISLRFH